MTSTLLIGNFKTLYPLFIKFKYDSCRIGHCATVSILICISLLPILIGITGHVGNYLLHDPILIHPINLPLYWMSNYLKKYFYLPKFYYLTPLVIFFIYFHSSLNLFINCFILCCVVSFGYFFLLLLFFLLTFVWRSQPG